MSSIATCQVNNITSKNIYLGGNFSTHKLEVDELYSNNNSTDNFNQDWGKYPPNKTYIDFPQANFLIGCNTIHKRSHPESLNNQSQVVGRFSVAKIQSESNNCQSSATSELKLDKLYENQVANSLIKKERKTSYSKPKSKENVEGGIDYCLLPKKGTAKPRQSRQRKMSEDGKRGKVLKRVKDCYTGARVKETVKERLENLRSQREYQEQLKRRAAQKRKNPYISSPKREDQMFENQRMMRNGNMCHSTESSSKCSKWSQNSFHTGNNIAPENEVMDSKMILKIYNEICYDIQQTLTGTISLSDFASLLTKYQRFGPLDVIINKPDNYTILHYLANLKMDEQKMFTGNITPLSETIMLTLCRHFTNQGLNMPDAQGKTALHLAVARENIGAINGLLKSAASPWVLESTNGDTALHTAVRTNNLNVINTLIIWNSGSELQRKATSSPLDIQNFSGDTPLHIAVDLYANSDSGSADIPKQILRALILHGASATVVNHENKTPAMLLPANDFEIERMTQRFHQPRQQIRASFSEDLYSIVESSSHPAKVDLGYSFSAPPFENSQQQRFQYSNQNTSYQIQSPNINNANLNVPQLSPNELVPNYPSSPLSPRHSNATSPNNPIPSPCMPLSHSPITPRSPVSYNDVNQSPGHYSTKVPTPSPAQYNTVVQSPNHFNQTTQSPNPYNSMNSSPVQNNSLEQNTNYLDCSPVTVMSPGSVSSSNSSYMPNTYNNSYLRPNSNSSSNSNSPMAQNITAQNIANSFSQPPVQSPISQQSLSPDPNIAYTTTLESVTSSPVVTCDSIQNFTTPLYQQSKQVNMTMQTLGQSSVDQIITDTIDIPFTNTPVMSTDSNVFANEDPDNLFQLDLDDILSGN